MIIREQHRIHATRSSERRLKRDPACLTSLRRVQDAAARRSSAPLAKGAGWGKRPAVPWSKAAIVRPGIPGSLESWAPNHNPNT